MASGSSMHLRRQIDQFEIVHKIFKCMDRLQRLHLLSKEMQYLVILVVHSVFQKQRLQSRDLARRINGNNNPCFSQDLWHLRKSATQIVHKKPKIFSKHIWHKFEPYFFSKVRLTLIWTFPGSFMDGILYIIRSIHIFTGFVNIQAANT